MSTTPRTDPLAFLDDEVAALQERHLYRPLRVMSSAQGPIVSVDDRRLISLSSNDYLGLTHHPRLREAALAAVREFGVGLRGGPDHRRDDVDARGARGGAGRLQGHARRPDLPVRLHGQHRRHPDHHRRDRPDRLGRAQPRLDHRRHAPVEGAAQDLPARRRRGAARRSSARRASAAATGRRAVPADPGRDRRGLLDGRRHRATPRASSRRPRRSARPSWSTTPMRRGVLGRNGRGTVDHFGLHGRVAIQVGTLSKAVGRARRVRRGLAGPARDPHPASPAVPLLDLAPAGRRRRLPRGDPGHGGGARARGAAVGEHPPVQGRADPARLRHRPLRDADHPGDDGRPRHRRTVQRRGSWRRASSPSPSSSRPSPSTSLGCGPSSPPPTPRAARPGARRLLDGRATNWA